jgi:hypothetical protein
MMNCNALRALVTLRVLADIQGDLNGPRATQRALVGPSGALQTAWDELGISNQYPFGFRTPPQLVKAVKILRSYGLVSSYGYQVTEAGFDAACAYDSPAWQDWAPLSEVVQD